MIKQLLNSAVAKYRDLSVARRSIISLCLRHQQIIDLLATDKSRYFAQSRPIIVYYSSFPVYVQSDQQVKYLSLTERRLSNHAFPIPCRNIPATTHIADQFGFLWLLNKNGTAVKVNYSTIFLPGFSNSLLRIVNLNS